MRAGRFRADLYYRLCSDLIVTPSLRDQLRDSPGELRNLVLFVSERVVGRAGAPELAGEVLECVTRDLGPDYPWPGNVRELEQCVRNVLVRQSYRPPAGPPRPPADDLAEAMREGSLTAKELLRRYCTTVYARTGSYQETARRLELDRRTVKRHIDPELLQRLQDDTPAPSYNRGDDMPQQFNTPHCVAGANDGMVYVCDRGNQRIQVFDKDGTFVKEALVDAPLAGGQVGGNP